tara:strand:- start:348 stop:776 length:429 start_codon:yes stop_codon:yes gene_type:complete
MNNEKFLQKYRTNKQAVWIKVKLVSGQEFFFDDYKQWKSIKTLCDQTGDFVSNLHLQFRSHEIIIDIENAEAIYFIRSIMGQMGGDSKHYYTVGVLRDNVVSKKMYIIPELIEEKSYEDDIDSCFPEGIIYNVQKKKENRKK